MITVAREARDPNQWYEGQRDGNVCWRYCKSLLISADQKDKRPSIAVKHFLVCWTIIEMHIEITAAVLSLFCLPFTCSNWRHERTITYAHMLSKICILNACTMELKKSEQLQSFLPGGRHTRKLTRIINLARICKLKIDILVITDEI